MPLVNNEVVQVFNSVLHKPFMPQNFGAGNQVEAALKRQFPGGVDAVVFGKSAVPGWSQVPNSKGIIAILIGLIVSPRDSASGLPTGRRQHLLFLKQGGALGFALDVMGANAGFVYQKIGWVS